MPNPPEPLEQQGRLFDLPHYQLNFYPQEVAFAYKKDGQWQQTSIQDFIAQVDLFSLGLRSLGVKKGDKIGIVSNYNCTPWHVVDMGAMQIGACLVPLYPNISENEYRYILNHAEVSICFVSDQDIFNKINLVKSSLPLLKDIYSFEDVSRCKNWQDVLNAGARAGEAETSALESIKSSILPDDLATIIYTSGTTGIPKGVMLSHRNILSNIFACKKRLPVNETAASLSFLPTCHIYERMMVYLYLSAGISVFFAESLETIGDNIREVRPNIIAAVPRLLEKVFSRIYAKGSELKGFKRKLFFWALSVADHYDFNGRSPLYRLKLLVARTLILSKWKAALGGRLSVIVSGSSALQVRLTKIFSACGITVLEGYGPTETSPVVAVGNSITGDLKLGFVGKPLDNMEVIIAEDGEILCKGPNVMLGYYKDPDGTQQAFRDGYYCTGDLGLINPEGYLKITGRKKEIFKTSGGKYIAPQPLENAMKLSPFIEQIMVAGEHKKMPSAIIQPNFEYLKEWAMKEGINIPDEALLTAPAVLDLYQREIEHYNQPFGKWERIKAFVLTPDVWSISDGHLTPTMKIKREVILEKYRAAYERLYEE